MITHLEPDILEWEVMWALESITTNKASGGDGIPVELFQILRDDAVKVLQWPQDWKEEYQTTWPVSWETYMQVRKQQLELGMEQSGSK